MTAFFLTHRAMRDLIEIEKYSIEKWGEARTEQYMNDLYHCFSEIAQAPETGKIRQQRSYPFLMAPAKKHFAIYQNAEKGIIIATILHGRRHIENIMDRIAPALAAEIEELLFRQ